MQKTPKDTKPKLSRREFLGTGAAAGAASLLPAGQVSSAAESTAAERPVLAAPSAAQMARETGAARPPAKIDRIVHTPVSDLMVQVLRDLQIEFVASNPGSSFEGLQESIINYGDTPNVMPEFISALHEESAVDMAHGYARCEGKPICALIQGTIGLQHAAMAIYQAFCGQAPVIILVGRDDKHFLQAHTADDVAAIVRPYTKWDAHPKTPAETLSAIQEAYRQSVTPPCGPVVVMLDSEIQKEDAGTLAVPEFVPPAIAGISQRQAESIAASLLKARNPRLHVGRLRTPEGIKLAVRLAEEVGASVDTRATSGPMSFPQRHPLAGPGDNDDYDFELGLERPATHVSIVGPGLRTLDDRDITGVNLGVVRTPRTAQHKPAGQNDIVADAEASLSLLIDAVHRQRTASNAQVVRSRTQRYANANHEARVALVEEAVEAARAGWEASPISLARIYAELWPLIRELDWCLASPSIFSGRHHVNLWNHDKPYSYLGSHPASALGYGLGASAGAALAARDRNRIVLNIQGDGDFNYTPGAMWTAAHHKLPMLTIMHNNRAWHMELMYLQYTAGVRGRGTDRAHIGTTFRDPYIDYAKLAAGYGVQGEGPISDPELLGPALARGVAAVQNGEPYLIDVLTQPR